MEGLGAVGCLVIPSLPIACEITDRPELRGRSLAVAYSDDPVIWSVSSLARARGVRPGQQVRHALAICPELDIVEGRPARYASVAATIVRNLHRVVYGLEPTEEGVVHVDLTGLAGEISPQSLVAAVLACAPPSLQPRLGIAQQRFTALVAAHQAQPRRVITVTVGDERAFLAPHPVDLLPVPAETIQRLRTLGLTTLGSVGGLPRAAVVAEFGKNDGTAIWTLANGEGDGAVAPYRPAELIAETLQLEASIVTLDHLMAAIEHVVNRLCGSPQFSTRAARQARLTLVTDRGGSKERIVTFHEPVSNAHTLWRLLGSALGGMQLPGAVTEIRLEIMGLMAAQGWQRSLSVDQGGRHEFLEEGLRKLRTQYGHCPVSRIVAVDPDHRLPENRWALIDRNP